MIFLGSLLPLPMVDGGTLLKWSLVDRGCTTQEAERQVRRAGSDLLAMTVPVLLCLWARRRKQK